MALALPGLAAQLWGLLRLQGQGGHWLLVVAVVVFVGMALLTLAGAGSPHQVVRWHARISRLHAELLAGPDWESATRALISDEYLEYLRDGPEHPERFPARVEAFRRSLTMGAMIEVPLAIFAVVLALAML